MLLKKRLSVEEMESQAAFQLPKRDMLALVNVVIFDVLNNLTVNIPVQNNRIAAQICAAVSALNTILVPANQLTCTVTQ